MKVLVAYDGTLQAKDALRYGISKVRSNGGELMVMHVFNTTLFFGYDSHPDAETLARMETSLFLDDARSILKEEGGDIRSRIIEEEGDPEEEIISYARARNVDILLCPPRFKSIIKRYRNILDLEGKKTNEETIPVNAEKSKVAVVTTQ